MDIGYARVSTKEQNLDAQLDVLTKAGCQRVYEERASGARSDRPILAEVMRSTHWSTDVSVCVPVT